jgi:hypothetical protein
MSDFVGELLDSRSVADLASRLYRIGDALRAKLISEKVNPGPSNTALIFFFARCFKTYQAAIELLRLGFPQDAAVLARVIREAANLPPSGVFPSSGPQPTKVTSTLCFY